MVEINNIHCLALNYKGVGNDNEPPLYFLKSNSCLTFEGGIIPYPTFEIEQVWTEVELVIVIGKQNSIKGFMVAGDVTCGNICNRDHHLPMSKSRTGFCPIGSFTPVIDVDITKPFTMTTSINGDIKQKGTTQDIKYDILTSINYVSKIIQLKENDIILTGTPITPGGGPQYDCLVKPGDIIKHTIEGIGEINYSFSS